MDVALRQLVPESVGGGGVVAHDVAVTAAASVWQKEQRPLTVGLVLTVTMIAFEALGVATAMPVAAAELGGVELYGWVFTGAMLASLVGIAVAGREVDRRGPAAPYLIGVLLFGAGLVIAGTATSMWVLVAGRVVQGLGIGALPSVVYATIGRSLTDAARARMFALLSTAWVVPGLVGPAVAGLVAENVGWRWVFLGILPLVAANTALTLRPLVRFGPPPTTEGEPTATARPAMAADALRLAVGVGLLIAGLTSPSWWSIPLVLAGGVIAARSGLRLLPRGVVRAAPGIPAAVSARGMQTWAFFTVNSFLPLAITAVQGASAVVAGAALTASTLTWTAGAWLQDHRGLQWGRRTLVVGGLTIVVVGVASTFLVLVPRVPVYVAAASWAIAGLGMGMSYSGLSLVVLAEARPGEEGAASAALQLSDVLGVAVGTGLGGAAVAAGETLRWRPAAGIAVAFALALAAASVSVAAARRLPSRVGDEPSVGSEPWHAH